MNTKNKHKSGYDLEILAENYKPLKEFVFINSFNKQTIDFTNPKAVKSLNTGLLKTHYNIEYWEFPESNLCPAVPGRVDYIHYLADLLKASNLEHEAQLLDIGTGATCIYPLLGTAEYNWSFIATDIDKKSISTAEKIIVKNKLTNKIELRLQNNKEQILKGIIKTEEQVTASLCNPPFYKSEAEAIEATERKWNNLGIDNLEQKRNFSGTANELWFTGGEKAFLHNYLYESSLFKTNCFWYSSLVSQKSLIKSMEKSLKKLGATMVKVIPMQQGQKTSRIVAWTFLSLDQQKKWKRI